MAESFNFLDITKRAHELYGLNDKSIGGDIKDSVISEALELYRSFAVAYVYIERDDLDSAKRDFERLFEKGRSTVSFIWDITDNHAEMLMDEDTLRAVVLACDMMDKCTHNLWVIALETHRSEEAEHYYVINAYARAELRFYRRVGECVAGASLNTGDGEERGNHRLCVPLSELYFFAFCIDNGEKTLEKYLSAVKGRERLHCYNAYRELMVQSSARAMEKLDTVGEYLCKTVDELQTGRMLYHSIFYESAALEYAYRNGMADVAEKIVRNGYDHYLELDTLHIIYRYEREKFYREIGCLKKLCLERGIALTGENYFCEKGYIRNLYGDEFCDDFVDAAERALDALADAGEDDPRLRKDRNTPKWAE